MRDAQTLRCRIQALTPLLRHRLVGFGHFAIALAFIGALRDPVRNIWLFTFGMIACALVVPYAFVFGALRGIPFWWRLIDCSFGVVGIIPLWLCRTWSKELESQPRRP
jgi:hypothetical protein